MRNRTKLKLFASLGVEGDLYLEHSTEEFKNMREWRWKTQGSKK